MYKVQTDHRINAISATAMTLCDRNGRTIVTARRDGDTWMVTADGVPDVSVPSADAITAMTEHALNALGGSGYSTFVPHGLML